MRSSLNVRYKGTEVCVCKRERGVREREREKAWGFMGQVHDFPGWFLII